MVLRCHIKLNCGHAQDPSEAIYIYSITNTGPFKPYSISIVLQTLVQCYHCKNNNAIWLTILLEKMLMYN